MSVVEVRGLCKSYPTFGLRDASFCLERGRIAGFIGRNGAGKTTTIKAMLNLVHPDSGEVYYFDKPLTGHETEIKGRIGYATGTVSYYSRKRIDELVSVVRRFYPSWDDEAYHHYRQLFSLDEGKTPAQLSEGMKVKLNLLLALSHRAEVLILDEPTSGLDPFSRNELMQIFSGLSRAGVSILFSTHIISDIEMCADDIIYISQGKIVAAMPKQSFVDCHVRAGDNLEAALLRLEKEKLEAALPRLERDKPEAALLRLQKDKPEGR